MSPCPHCKEANSEDARFCGGCGAELRPLLNPRRPRPTQRRPTRSSPRNPAVLPSADQHSGSTHEPPAEPLVPIASAANPPASDALAGTAASPAGLREGPTDGVATHRRVAEEPARGLQLLLLLTGILLLGLFCAPWRLSGARTFSWEQLPHLDALGFARRIYLVAGGLLFGATALLPLARVVRASMALFFGLLPLLLLWSGKTLAEVLLGVALLLLPAALLWRARARASRPARLLAALGVAAVLALLLLPRDGALPLLAGLAAAPTTSFPLVLAQLLPFVLLVLALLSLLTFLPRSSSGGVQIWATLLLFYLPTRTWLLASATLATGSVELAGVYEGLLWLLATACAAVGLAHLLPRPREAV